MCVRFSRSTHPAPHARWWHGSLLYQRKDASNDARLKKTHMEESPRARQLASLCVERWPQLRAILGAHNDLSAPYLAWVHPDYDEAPVRLVVVGKEPNGWGDRNEALAAAPQAAVKSLQAEYRRFRLGVDYAGRGSYWTPVHELYRRFNPGGGRFGFVALNASKMDQAESTPSPLIRSWIIRTHLLPDEIRVLEPHVVVFHTGPSYEEWLDGWFPGLTRTGDQWLARLRAPGLPDHSYRTYHPQYLNFKSRRKSIYDGILEDVRRAR